MEYDNELTDQVVAYNKFKVRKIAEITDKEVQVSTQMDVNQNSPTQANLSAIAIPAAKERYNHQMHVGDSSELIGVVDNSNILPLSLNESQNDALESRPLSGGSHQTSTQKLQQEMYLQERSILNERDVFANNESSLEGLEQQLMAAVESPKDSTHGKNEIIGKSNPNF